MVFDKKSIIDKYKNFRKYELFVWLILIIIVLMGLKLKFGYKGEIQIEELKITPTTIEVTPTIVSENDYPLEKYLPYYGKGFVVEKYTAPKTLKLILNGATQIEASEAVSKWVDGFGDAIGVHKIIISN